MSPNSLRLRFCSLFLCLLALGDIAAAACKPVTPRKPGNGEIPVDAPGNLDKPGATYILTKDIIAPTSAFYAAKDITLDLNGYSIVYASGYKGVPNCGFEEGLKGWDVSKAPEAEAKSMLMRHPLVGKNVCVLPQGQEIVSPYVELPVANRSYYAMAAVAAEGMNVGIYVEDENGKSVECAFTFDGNTRPCCPEKERSPKLGGGTVFALMFGRAAGKYRIRVKAVNRDCVIDEVDIRPALDVGVGIVQGTLPWAYYKCVLEGDGCAFFDVNDPRQNGKPVASIPHAEGAGTVTIRNGTIRLGSKAIRTWGVQSTAKDVKVVFENVTFEAQGIDTLAVEAACGSMKDCRTEIDAEWVIDRHRQQAYSVWFGGKRPNEIIGCEFIGGQGQVAFSADADNSVVRDNLFVNKQKAVNRYSLGAGGNGTKVFHNRFLPEQGSGMLVYKKSGLDIYENEFRIEASMPVNEYATTDYSVSAIRMTDYNSASNGCVGNRFHHNKVHLTGRTFPGAHEGYKPMVYGVFMSVGSGQNYVHDNEIVMEHKDGKNGEQHGVYAFYIGGSNNGGTYYNNTITANVCPVWIGNMYGVGENCTFYNNTIRKAKGATSDFVPFRLGWHRSPAKNIGFYSNTFDGIPFAVDITDHTTGFSSEYAYGWMLTVKTKPGAEVAAVNQQGETVLRKTADDKGALVLPLAEYKAAGRGRENVNGKLIPKIAKTGISKYTIKANGKEIAVVMNKDQTVEL